MTLIYRVLQELTEEEKRAGETQVFVGHEFHRKDLRAKVERGLQTLGLQAYFADKHLTGGYVLDKICKKIVVARASIMDLSLANPNVYFELGVSIGLNKPVFIVLKKGANVPPLLEGFVKLRFSSYAGLEKDLAEQMPPWLEHSIEHHLLYDTHCHFVDVLCADRQRLSAKRTYLILDEVITEEDGYVHHNGDADFQAELPTALDRFHFAPIVLDSVLLSDKFRLCNCCRLLRDSQFTIAHLTHRTSQNVYLLLGLATGLGLPALLVARKESDTEGKPLCEMPSMLLGLDRLDYEHSVELAETLGDRLDEFLTQQKSTPMFDKKLSFYEPARRERDAEPEIPAALDSRHDSSQQSELEKALKTLAETSNLPLEPSDLLATIVTTINEVLHADHTTLFVYDQVQQRFIRGVQNHPDAPPFFPDNTGFSEMIARTQEAQFVPQAEKYPMSSPIFVENKGIRSFAAVPLLSRGATVGVLYVNYFETHEFAADERNAIHLLAIQAAEAITNVGPLDELEPGAEESEEPSGDSANDTAQIQPSAAVLPKRILIIEDDHDWQTLLSEAIASSIAKLDFTSELHVANTRGEAMRFLESQPSCDLVLTDLHLSPKAPADYSGVELARWVRDRDPRAPVVVITGVHIDQRTLRLLFKDIGVHDVLEKGRFQTSDLDRIARETLGKAPEPRPSTSRGSPEAVFINRQKEQAFILRAVENRESVSIVGARGIGKSFLLAQIQRQLQVRGDLCIRVDLQGSWTEDGFFSAVQRALEQSGVTISEDGSEPLTTRIEIALTRLSKDRRVTLLLDEFEGAAQGYQEKRYSDRFFGWLRSLAGQGVVSIVTATASQLPELALGSRYTSPFSNVFRTIHLEALDRASAVALATSNGNIQLSEEELSFILEATEGHPLFIRMLRDLLVDEKNKNQGVANLKRLRDQWLELSRAYRTSVESS